MFCHKKAVVKGTLLCALKTWNSMLPPDQVFRCCWNIDCSKVGVHVSVVWYIRHRCIK